jgi:hypothetical protein
MRGPLLVLGCEVTPMAKTQSALVTTLRALLHAATDGATALLTVDACALQQQAPSSSSVGKLEYPRVCPMRGPQPCAGHRFLALAEAEGGLEWSVERVWTAEEARAACHVRRVRGEDEGGGDGGCEAVDFGAVTAPEGLVLVSLTTRRRERR